MNEKIRNILIFSPHFFPESFRINELATELVKSGLLVTVVTGTPNYPQGQYFKDYGIFKRVFEVIDGVRVIRVPVIPRGKGRSFELVLNYLSYTISAVVLVFFLLLRRFDNVFVFQTSPITVAIPAILYFKIKRVPSTIWVQDLWPESLSATGHVRNSALLKFADNLCGLIYRCFDTVLMQSKAFETTLISKRVKKERLAYVPNWAESSILESSTATPAPEYPEIQAQFRVVFTGNLGYAQDLDTLLDAAFIVREKKEVQWFFIGDGTRRFWAEEQVKNRGLMDTVHFLGSFPSSRMPEFFAGSDALLVSLRSDPAMSATIPSKVQAYLAAGRPILGALDGEGANVIKTSGAGFVSPAGDARGLACSLTRLLQMKKSEREFLGRQGQDFFNKNFEQNYVIGQLRSHFFEQRIGN